MNENSLQAKLAQRGCLGGSQPTWAPHPTNAGVAICSLVRKDDSAGALATLLVRLDAGASMAPHRHDKETEQHVVLDGDGVLTLDGEPYDYQPGQVAVIAMGREHAIVAGPGGMVLLAMFSPAP